MRQLLQRLAQRWSDVNIYPIRAGGDCDVCGNYTRKGMSSSSSFALARGERVTLGRSCYVKWTVERNRRFSADPPPD